MTTEAEFETRLARLPMIEEAEKLDAEAKNIPSCLRRIWRAP